MADAADARIDELVRAAHLVADVEAVLAAHREGFHVVPPVG